MRKNSFLFASILAFSMIATFPAVMAAHFIVGYVHDAADGTSPNGRLVELWNPTLGSDVITGLVGPSGPSLTSNVFLIDCELLNTSCSVGDTLNVTLQDDGSGYISLSNLEVNVTGAGFDATGNLSMNSPPNITNMTFDDSFTGVAFEIDLTPANTTWSYCSGVVTEYEGNDTFTSFFAEIFSTNAGFGDADDNNNHYSNSSCVRNDTYGTANEVFINCTFQIEYYADATNWTCVLNATDEHNITGNLTGETAVNTLLALGVNDTLDFGNLSAQAMSGELSAQVINYGNVPINLSLSGHGNATGDGNALTCDTNNISIEHMKYNFTDSNPGFMTLADALTNYINLSGSPTQEPFNLDQRTNDATNDAYNFTYWRVYVPATAGTSCQGNIIFGAST